MRSSWTGLGASTLEQLREVFKKTFPNLLAATPGGRAELRELVDPAFRDLVDELPDGEVVPVRSYQMATARAGEWTSGRG